MVETAAVLHSESISFQKFDDGGLCSAVGKTFLFFLKKIKKLKNIWCALCREHKKHY